MIEKCGLCCPKKFNIKFELKSIITKCDIRNTLATFECEFVYENKNDTNEESTFYFPLHGNCVVYSFEATMNDKKLIGVCKELEEAKNTYKAAVEKGETAAIIERSSEMHDVFSCKLGNFLPNSTGKICIKFSQELVLSLVQEKNAETSRFELDLPMILRPRYNITNSEFASQTKFTVINKVEYQFDANFTTTKPILSIESTHYKVTTTFTNTQNTQATVHLENFDGQNDMDLIVKYSGSREAFVYYELGTAASQLVDQSNSESSFFKPDVAMLNFLPQFHPKFTNNSGESKFEIVFIVDRSGSMSGNNIQKAKECLLIFLKSLPTNCKFQIYGFGSNFDKSFNQSELYSDASMATALRYQENIDANMGGTNIYDPIDDMLKQEVASDYGRLAFLMTDGDVGNQDVICQLVRKHRSKTRIFTVGIGNGVSTSLVNEISEAGNGHAVFVRDDGDLSEKVMELLDLALNTKVFSSVDIKFNCPEGVSAVVVPQEVPQLFTERYLTAFCMIKGLQSSQEIIGTLSGKLGDETLSFTLKITSKDAIDGKEFPAHRLLAKYRIDELSKQIKDGLKEDEVKKSLIELSLEANIVSDYTTFVAVDEDQLKQKITVIQEPEPELPGGFGGDCMARRCFKMSMPPPQSMHFGAPVPRAFAMNSMAPQLMSFGSAAPQSSAMMSFGSAAPQSSAMEPPPPPPQEKSCGFIGPPAPPAPPPPPPSSNQNVDYIMEIVKHQNIMGFWKMDVSLLTKLGIDKTIVMNLKPGNVTDDNLWMTVIICQYLQLKCAEGEKKWRLIHKKATKWIIKNANIDETNLEALSQIASKLF